MHDPHHSLRFPIGPFDKPKVITPSHIEDWIGGIERFPERIRSLVSPLSSKELEYRYRPDGWTIGQLVNHCADSHLNGYIRFKLALTEDHPTIRPYDEAAWAESPEYRHGDLDNVLHLIEFLHQRWVFLLRSLDQVALTRTFMHPEYGQTFALAENIGVYAWHSAHHTAHIRRALEHPY